MEKDTNTFHELRESLSRYEYKDSKIKKIERVQIKSAHYSYIYMTAFLIAVSGGCFIL